MNCFWKPVSIHFFLNSKTPLFFLTCPQNIIPHKYHFILLDNPFKTLGHSTEDYTPTSSTSIVNKSLSRISFKEFKIIFRILKTSTKYQFKMSLSHYHRNPSIIVTMSKFSTFKNKPNNHKFGPNGQKSEWLKS